MIEIQLKTFKGFSPFDHLQNLRSLYPNIKEVFGGEQFYRQNVLPVELNDLIEEYCLDLDNLNGPKAEAWRLNDEFKVDLDSYTFWLYPWLIEVSNNWKLNPDRATESQIRSELEKFNDFITNRETELSMSWAKDKRNYFKYRKLIFNSLTLKESFSETTESIEDNVINEIT